MAHAQEAHIVALLAAAQEGDPEAQRTLGEARIYGLGGEQDIRAGIALLEQAAEQGDLRAKTSLGKILLDGYYLPAQPDRAVPLLEQAAEAGDPRAQTTLGAALLWGAALPVDAERARFFLLQAARQNDPEALRILGEQLVHGWVLDQDTRTGLAMLEQAAASGAPEAQIALGKALITGPDAARNPARAVEMFEAAAKSGDGEGLEAYGSWLMWNWQKPDRAERYLRRAGEMGRATAWTTLAEGAMYGYLPPRSRAKFRDYADRARAAGQDRIAVLEAERLMWGINMRASGPKALEHLDQAAASGNTTALRYLVRLARDGNGMNIPRDPDLARDILTRHLDQLPAIEAAQLAFSIDAAAARRPDAMGTLAETASRQPQLMTPDLAKEVYEVNPNAAVYLIQQDMARRGLYDGPLDGQATSPTLRAMHAACQGLPDTTRCDQSVMHPEVIAALLTRSR